jgi:NUMOD3 motif/HNH endonuclease
MSEANLIKSPIQIKRIFTAEHRAKLSLAKKGKAPWNKGKTFTEEHRENLSKAHIGKPHPHGGKPNYKTRGEKNWKWKGGITPINAQIRHSIEYKLWRKAVFERDDYTCVWCGKRGTTLNADHIKPFARFPELRFAIDNGRTLCVPCHKLTPTYGYNKENYV